MIEKKRTMLSLVAVAFFCVAFGLPTTGFAEQLYRATVSVQFESSLDQSDRVGFADEKFNEFDGEGLNGYIAVNQEFGVVLVEGEKTTVVTEVRELDDDNRLASVSLLDGFGPESAAFDSLALHTELDVQQSSPATQSASTYKRTYVRAKFRSDMTDADKSSWHDSYFANFANDGLGGLLVNGNGHSFVNGNGHSFLTIELEGATEDVDYWLKQLSLDKDLDSMTVLRSTYPSQRTFHELVGHIPDDERDNTN